VTTIDPTSAGITTTAGATGPMGQASSLGGLGSEAFLKLMVAQLRYQNPMEPSDPSQMMLQTAQFTQLESMQELVKLQQRDLGLQEAVMAAGLMGDEVTAAQPDGSVVTGTVQGVRYTTAGPSLDLGGDIEVGLGQVTEIRRVAAQSADATA
jgi:flagellar basal-body rod modification protein FlgD